MKDKISLNMNLFTWGIYLDGVIAPPDFSAILPIKKSDSLKNTSKLKDCIFSFFFLKEIKVL